MMDDYDVFLNHRGPDVKVGFMAHLEKALRQAGLNPFLDKKSLVKGDVVFTSIDDAMEVAKVHVAVVSRRYAESKYCLNELVVMMRSGKPVIPVLYDVEPVELRRPADQMGQFSGREQGPFLWWGKASPRVEKGLFAEAFEKHKSRETMEQVEEWADALRKVKDITAILFRSIDYEGDEAELVQKVVDAVLSKLPKDELLEVEHHLFGLEVHVNTCINKVETICGTTGILCLTGMGGIGKTTIAKVIFNKFIDHKKFQAMSFLEIDRIFSPSNIEVVSESLLTRLRKKLLWDILRVPDNSQQSYKYWFHKLKRKGPILVVLDNIHDKNQFDKLILDTSLLAPGSCIIITSRDRHLLNVVAGGNNVYIHEVTLLGCDDSQKLFNRHASRNKKAPESFKAYANDVSKACGGLPLALKVVGSSLCDKKSDEDKECIWPEAIDALKGDLDIMKVLKWSYNCLPEVEKMMFLDIAYVFYGWEKDDALEMWLSCKNKCSSCCGQGSPHMSLRHLMEKSLVEIEYGRGRYVFAMHRLLRDMGESIGNVNGSHLWENKAVKAVEGKNQGANKVRALNLANSEKQKFGAEDFAKMENLHFLVLDGCNVSGDFRSIPKELRWLRWRYMPLTHLPPILNLSNLISLDFSQSTNLNFAWGESDLAFEACPNLLNLDMSECTSITTLPDSIGRLSKLQFLKLNDCTNLQRLPSSVGQLTALEKLVLSGCSSLGALLDTISALSRLTGLFMWNCSSKLCKLPLVSGITILMIDLVTEEQATGIGNLNALEVLSLMDCTDEVMTMLDNLDTFRNLDKLSSIWFVGSRSITKVPETIGQLTCLEILEFFKCENLQELPNSIGELKLLRILYLVKCNHIETLPDSLGAMTNLKSLWIYKCKSITKFPSSIGELSRLRELRIEGSKKLQSLPDSIRKLNELQLLEIFDCGNLEGLGALKIMRGFHLWGCTSVIELPGSCLRVVDNNSGSWDPTWFNDLKGVYHSIRQKLKDLGLVDETACGYLRLVQEVDTGSGRLILQRVHNLICTNMPIV